MRKGRKLRIVVAILSIISIITIVYIEVSSGLPIDKLPPPNKMTKQVVDLCTKKFPSDEDNDSVQQCIEDQIDAAIIIRDAVLPVIEEMELPEIKLFLTMLVFRCMEENTDEDDLTDHVETLNCVDETLDKILDYEKGYKKYI